MFAIWKLTRRCLSVALIGVATRPSSSRKRSIATLTRDVPGRVEDAEVASRYSLDVDLAPFQIERLPLRSTLLTADVFAERFIGLYPKIDWTAEAGIRHQLTPVIVVDTGIGWDFAASQVQRLALVVPLVPARTLRCARCGPNGAPASDWARQRRCG
jgi:hypothetical protein